MKKLLIYLREYRKECLLGPLAKLLEAGFELMVPLVVASMIDHGIGQADKSHLVWMSVLLMGLGLIGLVAAMMAQYFAAKAATGFTAKVRHALFAHLQELSHRELDEIGTSTMLTRLTSDMNQVQNGVNLTLRLLLRSPFVVLGAMAMAFTIDAKAALIFAVTIPVLFAVVFAIMLVCIPLYRRVQERLDAVTLRARENLSGVRVLRAFGAEPSETAAFRQRNEALAASQLFVGKISALMNPLTFVIVNLAIVWLIHTGALRVDAGALSRGQVVALYNYMSQILVELIKAANLILTLTRAVACGNRIEAILEVKSSMTFPAAPPAAVDTDVCVEFDDVSFRYNEGGEPALSHLSLKVKRGQTIGIIGGTGAGKSTLVNLIGRFYDTSEGTVRVDGIDVRQYPKEQLRRKLGIVPQKAVLFRGTLGENLRWGNPDASDAEVYQALQTAQATEVAASKGGLEAQVEAGGRNFSGGQRQRLTIARALVRKPEILILDDSASALDYATDAALRKALRNMADRPTVFLISQRTASLRHADLIVVLDDGQVAGMGTHEELLDSCPVYREIHESQFGKEAAPCEKA